ncbi:hypothetical protein JD969_15905 [Planctomycetota bacterium]|nr:hypothetical protein JD969_15905 [Planctomycetota bacterium]
MLCRIMFLICVVLSFNLSILLNANNSTEAWLKEIDQARELIKQGNFSEAKPIIRKILKSTAESDNNDIPLIIKMRESKNKEDFKTLIMDYVQAIKEGKYQRNHISIQAKSLLSYIAVSEYDHEGIFNINTSVDEEKQFVTDELSNLLVFLNRSLNMGKSEEMKIANREYFKFQQLGFWVDINTTAGSIMYHHHQVANHDLSRYLVTLTKSVPQNHAAIAVVLLNKSEVPYLYHNISEAQTLIKKALDHIDKIKDPPANLYAEAWNRYGITYLSARNFAQANKAFNQALKYTRHLPKHNKHNISLLILRNLALQNALQSKHNNTEKHLTKTLKLVTDKYGQNHIKTAEELLEIADFRLRFNQNKKAFQCIQNARKIINFDNPKHTVPKLISDELLIRYYLITGRTSDANPLIKNHINYCKTHKLIMSLAEFNQKMACIFIDLNRYNDAQATISYAEQFYRSSYPQFTTEHLNALEILGDIYVQKEQYSQALRCYKHVQQDRSIHCHNHRPSMIPILRKLSNLYEKLNDQPNAQKAISDIQHIMKEQNLNSEPEHIKIFKYPPPLGCLPPHISTSSKKQDTRTKPKHN